MASERRDAPGRRPDLPGIDRCLSLLGGIGLAISGCQGFDNPSAGAHPCPGPPNPIVAHTLLAPGCVYAGGLRIAASDVVLDCRGGVIDARGKTGIVVGGQTTVTGVVIRNCHVLDGNIGIYIGLAAADNEKQARHDRDTLYRITPHDIRIDRCTVADSANVGIYVDDYASGVTIADSTVRGSGSAGIYLEHSSRNNVIVDSLITANGYGRLPRLRFGVARREGIAVDSSAGNRIEGNRIGDNAAGGIFLYTNCHEHAGTDPASVPRWQHADDNLIRGNHIADTPVGVWLASRQSRDLGDWDCGDAPYFAQRYFLDHARRNRVEGNHFHDVTTGVRIEDDFNAVVGNTFTATSSAIEIGATIRERVLGQPVTGTLVQDNIHR